MSCCDNPTVKARSMQDQQNIAVYCPLAQSADTNMFLSYKSGVYGPSSNISEGYCSSCPGIQAWTQSAYPSMGNAYSHNQFPVPTGGRSCIGYIKY